MIKIIDLPGGQRAYEFEGTQGELFNELQRQILNHLIEAFHATQAAIQLAEHLGHTKLADSLHQIPVYLVSAKEVAADPKKNVNPKIVRIGRKMIANPKHKTTS